MKVQKGFTLIELLIVVAILGILAAVVIPNVVGLLGRGGKQAYATDEATIQLGVQVFSAEIHSGFDAGAWGNVSKSPGHYYPTAIGVRNDHTLILGNETDVNGSQIVNVAYNTEAEDADITAHAIWMGLLVNVAGDWQDETRMGVSPLAGETDLFLQKMPKSAMTGELYNGGTREGGSYCWVVGKGGTVYGVYKSGELWYAGFSGVYP